jgi:hypothetical protein
VIDDTSRPDDDYGSDIPLFLRARAVRRSLHDIYSTCYTIVRYIKRAGSDTSASIPHTSLARAPQYPSVQYRTILILIVKVSTMVEPSMYTIGKESNFDAGSNLTETTAENDEQVENVVLNLVSDFVTAKKEFPLKTYQVSYSLICTTGSASPDTFIMISQFNLEWEIRGDEDRVSKHSVRVIHVALDVSHIDTDPVVSRTSSVMTLEIQSAMSDISLRKSMVIGI